MAKDSDIFSQLPRNADLKELSQSITNVGTCFGVREVGGEEEGGGSGSFYRDGHMDVGLFVQSIRKAPAVELADIIAGNIDAPITDKVSVSRWPRVGSVLDAIEFAHWI